MSVDPADFGTCECGVRWRPVDDWKMTHHCKTTGTDVTTWQSGRVLVPDHPRRPPPPEPQREMKRAALPPSSRRCSIAGCTRLFAITITKIEKGPVLGESFYACDDPLHQNALEAKLHGLPDPRLPWARYMKALGHHVPEELPKKKPAAIRESRKAPKKAQKTRSRMATRPRFT